MCKKWMLRYFPILLSFCHRNPYYQSSACILYPLPVWHVIIVLSPYECPSLIEWKNWDTYFTRSLSLLHHISPQWHLSNPYLGRAGALLPNLLLPGAWRGAGLPLRGWLQQDLQQVDTSVLFTEPIELFCDGTTLCFLNLLKTMLMDRLEGWGQSQYQSYQERYNSQFYAQVKNTIKNWRNLSIRNID